MKYLQLIIVSLLLAGCSTSNPSGLDELIELNKRIGGQDKKIIEYYQDSIKTLYYENNYLKQKVNSQRHTIEQLVYYNDSIYKCFKIVSQTNDDLMIWLRSYLDVEQPYKNTGVHTEGIGGANP